MVVRPAVEGISTTPTWPTWPGPVEMVAEMLCDHLTGASESSDSRRVGLGEGDVFRFTHRCRIAQALVVVTPGMELLNAEVVRIHDVYVP